jgi:hypothetical protein
MLSFGAKFLQILTWKNMILTYTKDFSWIKKKGGGPNSPTRFQRGKKINPSDQIVYNNKF